MEKKFNHRQMIPFALMEHVALDGFDAKRVIADLTKHRDLWQAAIMMPDPNRGPLPLRDRDANRWNVDCLSILVADGDRGPLNERARGRNPTELMWLGEEDRKGVMRILVMRYALPSLCEDFTSFENNAAIGTPKPRAIRAIFRNVTLRSPRSTAPRNFS